jgi:hypothetical protein
MSLDRAIDSLKFRLNGRSVNVLKVSDSNEDGKILTLQTIGKVRLRPNSLVEAWDPKAWEIDPAHPGYITLIDAKGNIENSRVVSSAGRTVDLYISPNFTKDDKAPDREDVLGRAATMDDIADSMDLGRSMRNMVIGAIVSAPLWWLIANLGR